MKRSNSKILPDSGIAGRGAQVFSSPGPIAYSLRTLSRGEQFGPRAWRRSLEKRAADASHQHHDGGPGRNEKHRRHDEEEDRKDKFNADFVG